MNVTGQSGAAQFTVLPVRKELHPGHCIMGKLEKKPGGQRGQCTPLTRSCNFACSPHLQHFKSSERGVALEEEGTATRASPEVLWFPVTRKFPRTEPEAMGLGNSYVISLELVIIK